MHSKIIKLDRLDVDAVVRLESFRALKLSRLENFRVLKITASLESFRALKLSKPESFRALKLSYLDSFRALKLSNLTTASTSYFQPAKFVVIDVLYFLLKSFCCYGLCLMSMLYLLFSCPIY